MFFGKIGSGKSTLAARLAEQPGAVLVGEDQLLASLYPGEITTLEDYRRSADRLRKALGPHLETLLRAGLTLVMDFQANTPDARAWMLGIAKTAGAAHQLHLLDVDEVTCLERLHRRNAEGRHPYQVSDEDFALFNAHVAPPAQDEGLNIVRHG